MLKALLLKKKIDLKKRELDALKVKAAELETRGQELAAAIEEVENDEQREEVEGMVAEYEKDKTENDSAVSALEDEIRGLETELETEEAAQDTTPPAEERKEEKMIKRNFFENKEEMIQREDVQAWIKNVRSCMTNHRAVENVGVTIPSVLLGLLRERIEGYSKLYKHVKVERVGGNATLPIMGSASEAIWTDCCANLNELDITFNNVEVGCHKVGGYFAMCNAALEDSDIDLANALLGAIGQAIGLALDKAILFGRNGDGTQKMPEGVVTRLVQTSKPAGYPATARTWVDLHTTNIKTTGDSTGIALFQKIVTFFGAASAKYSGGEKVWCMNSKTHTKLIAEAMNVDAAGAIVSSVGNSMPVIGGTIEELEFLEDNDIIAGYFDCYLLAERGGEKFASSEHVRFLADQTVFKGTARYDGAPAIAEAFVAIGLNTTPDATMTFAPDEANTPASVRLNTSTASVAVGGSLKLRAIVEPVDAPVTWASGTEAKATVDSETGVVSGVASGSSVITATTANGLTASCVVTVTT